MSLPNWYVLSLLALAAFRTWRLLAEDDILDRPRRALLRFGENWEKEGDPVPDNFRASTSQFLTCPWCAGFWIALLWWGAYQIWEWGVTIAATPFALSALVALLALLRPDQE